MVGVDSAEAVFLCTFEEKVAFLMSNDAPSEASRLSMAASVALGAAPYSTWLSNLGKNWVTNQEELKKIRVKEEEIQQEVNEFNAKHSKVTEQQEATALAAGKYAYNPKSFFNRVTGLADVANSVIATSNDAPTTLKSIEETTEVAKKVLSQGLIAFVGIMVVLLIAVIVFKSVAVKQRGDYLKRN